MHICISLADVHIIADTDYISHERDHVCSLADSLAVSYLALALIQILYLKT